MMKFQGCQVSVAAIFDAVSRWPGQKFLATNRQKTEAQEKAQEQVSLGPHTPKISIVAKVSLT